MNIFIDNLNLAHHPGAPPEEIDAVLFGGEWAGGEGAWGERV